MLLVVKLQDVV